MTAQTIKDTVETTLASAAIASPAWLHYVSDTASLLLPICGVGWFGYRFWSLWKYKKPPPE